MKINKNSVFYKPKPFKERVLDFFKSIPFWRGRKKGMIHTRSLEWSDLRYIFWPRGFAEKYGYLGSVPWKEDGDIFKAMYPLVLAMDYEAKPRWCPRWFLRFLHVFGSDKSIVRVRNWYWHNLSRRITKGLLIVDWKTKWTHYDLRISVHAPEHLQELASAIEDRFYSQGRQEELVEQIKKLDLNASIIWGSISRLEKQLQELEEKKKTHDEEQN
jgi:hypothetical protein